MSRTYAALGDDTRRAILAHLKGGEMQLSTLASHFDMTQTGVSKHVGVLAAAGLVVVEKRGRARHCRLEAHTLKDAHQWLGEYESFWRSQLRQLRDHLEQ